MTENILKEIDKWNNKWNKTTRNVTFVSFVWCFLTVTFIIYRALSTYCSDGNLRVGIQSQIWPLLHRMGPTTCHHFDICHYQSHFTWRSLENVSTLPNRQTVLPTLLCDLWLFKSSIWSWKSISWQHWIMLRMIDLRT